MVHNKKLSEGQALSIGSFQKVQREVLYFPYVGKKMKSIHKLPKNCNIYGKNREIFGMCNFCTPVKRNSPDVWN